MFGINGDFYGMNGGLGGINGGGFPPYAAWGLFAFTGDPADYIFYRALKDDEIQERKNEKR